MCFYHDYDWLVSIQEINTETAGPKGLRCDECGRHLSQGTSYIHIYQQENDPDDAEEGQEMEEFDPGNTFEYDRCLDCDKLLQAIEAVERDNGCKGSATRPCLTELRDALQEDEGGLYIERARLLFPQLDEPYLRHMQGE